MWKPLLLYLESNGKRNNKNRKWLLLFEENSGKLFTTMVISINRVAYILNSKKLL